MGKPKNEVIPAPDNLPAAQTLSPVALQLQTYSQMVERVAANPEADIDKMERLLDMQERILDKAAEQEFKTAMSQAQAEMTAVSKNASNPQTHSQYADYAALDSALRPTYTKYGFSITFDTDPDKSPEGTVRILCEVSHSGGFSRIHTVDMDNTGKGAKGGDVMTKTHASGAAMTYGMRYLLKLAFNVAVGEFDPDGNVEAEKPPAAEERVKKKEPPKKQKVADKKEAGLNEGQIKMVNVNLERHKVDESAVLSQWKVKSLEVIPRNEANAVLEWIKTNGEES